MCGASLKVWSPTFGPTWPAARKTMTFYNSGAVWPLGMSFNAYWHAEWSYQIATKIIPGWAATPNPNSTFVQCVFWCNVFPTETDFLWGRCLPTSILVHDGDDSPNFLQGAFQWKAEAPPMSPTDWLTYSGGTRGLPFPTESNATGRAWSMGPSIPRKQCGQCRISCVADRSMMYGHSYHLLMSPSALITRSSAQDIYHLKTFSFLGFVQAFCWFCPGFLFCVNHGPRILDRVITKDDPDPKHQTKKHARKTLTPQ